MSKFLNKKFCDLVPYIPGEQPQNTVYIKLNTNESPFPPARPVADILKGLDCDRLRLYPDPENTRLVSSYAKTLGLCTENVFAGNGSDEVLAFIFQAFFEDSGVAFPDITYGFYPVYSDLYQIKSEIIPLLADFTVDIDSFFRTDRPIVLANPNAPTGICLSLAEIEQLLVSNRDRLVVIDEAYIDFGGESCVPLIKKYNNLLVVHTFSKSRSLAGARIGFALGDESIIADLKRIKYSFNSYNVNRLTEDIAVATLSDTQYFNDCCRQIIENREFVCNALDRAGFSVLESKANFIFAKNQKISGNKLYLALKSRGILVRYFDKERLREYVRITIGSRQQCEALICSITEILEGL